MSRQDTFAQLDDTVAWVVSRCLRVLAWGAAIWAVIFIVGGIAIGFSMVVGTERTCSRPVVIDSNGYVQQLEYETIRVYGTAVLDDDFQNCAETVAEGNSGAATVMSIVVPLTIAGGIIWLSIRSGNKHVNRVAQPVVPQRTRPACTLHSGCSCNFNAA